MNEPCLEMSGNVLGSLYNVELANIRPFTPSIEEWYNSSGDLESTAVMRVSDLELSSMDISFHGTYHQPKDRDQIDITPMKINTKQLFVLSDVSHSCEDIICSL